MKIYVMYDQTGRIRGTAASSVDGAHIGLHPSLSYLEEELEIKPAKIKQHLQHLHKTSKVDTTSKPHRRIPKA
jgi:hypothetical protein